MSSAKYTKIEAIGHGSFGKVYKAKDESGALFALKDYIVINGSIGNGFRNLIEINTLRELADSEFVVNLVDITYNKPSNNDPRNRHIEGLSIVTELADCDGHYFFNVLKCSPQVAVYTACQLLLALEHINRRKIAHRDIKPSNILIFNINGLPHLKLCDFGISSFLCDSCSSTPDVFSPYWRPPEVCWGVYNHTYTTDDWAVACVIYSMFTGKDLLQDCHITDRNNRVDNNLLFNSIVARNPNTFENNIRTLYTNNSPSSSKHIRVNRASQKQAIPFFDQFKTLPQFDQLNANTWRCIESLLMGMMSYNYLTRTTSAVALRNSVFFNQDFKITYKGKEHRVDLVDFISKHRRATDTLMVLNVIEHPQDDDFLHQVTQAAESLLSRNISECRHFIRNVYHAVDLVFEIHRRGKLGEYSVLNALEAGYYLYQKFFGTLIVPEPIERVVTGYSSYPRDWIERFELLVVQEIFPRCTIYRPTMFELSTYYHNNLTFKEYRDILFHWLNLREYTIKASYRAMYRHIYTTRVKPGSTLG